MKQMIKVNSIIDQKRYQEDFSEDFCIIAYLSRITMRKCRGILICLFYTIYFKLIYTHFKILKFLQPNQK